MYIYIYIYIYTGSSFYSEPYNNIPGRHGPEYIFVSTSTLLVDEYGLASLTLGRPERRTRRLLEGYHLTKQDRQMWKHHAEAFAQPQDTIAA